jgi:hypothetical protein
MCRLPHAGALARGRKYLERARALTRRAEALGAELVSWGAASVAFGWDPELVEETVSFVVGLHDDTGWSCGVSEGEMEPLGEGASRATLAWGEPLLRAFSLARIAAPGEVLVDERVSAAEHLALGAVRIGSEAGQGVRGAVLDVQRPWNPVVDAPPVSARSPQRVAERTLELVRHAVRSRSGRDALAARMQAIARLSRGEVADALASLQKVRAASAGQPRVVQCQASLALAVALLAAGLPDEALLEALDALAHARAASDLRSTGACLAFLAKLFARVGRPHDAERIAVELAKLPRTSMPSLAPTEI